MTSAPAPLPVSAPSDTADTAPVNAQIPKSNYKGFVAGVFSGIAKLSGTF
jgi:solute carrier family 25 carnitine/acylcarnitine transporter 20/29